MWTRKKDLPAKWGAFTRPRREELQYSYWGWDVCKCFLFVICLKWKWSRQLSAANRWICEEWDVREWSFFCGIFFFFLTSDSVCCTRSPEASAQNSDSLKPDSWKLHVAMLSIFMLKRGKGSDGGVYQAFLLWFSLLFLGTVLTRLLTPAGCFLILFLGENCVEWMLCFHKRGEMSFLPN